MRITNDAVREVHVGTSVAINLTCDITIDELDISERFVIVMTINFIYSAPDELAVGIATFITIIELAVELNIFYDDGIARSDENSSIDGCGVIPCIGIPSPITGASRSSDGHRFSDTSRGERTG